ncbi:MAG: ABC transporter substrate-binding protein [Caldilineaceae bacterium]|nr:ABC transporter substrate-binding protein [Caldilineaceae bacterium]
MSYQLTRRRFLHAAGAGLSLPFLAQLMSACQAISPGSSQPLSEITWSRGDDLRTQDPQLIAGRMEGEINRCIYDQLFDTAPDGSQINWLATEFSSNPEGTVWTVKMQEGTKFHDGSPVTSEDVKFTFERLLANPEFQHSTAFKDLLASVDAPDAATVVFTCSKPAPLFNLILGEHILSKKSADENGENFWEKAIGSGPFRHLEYVKGEYWLGEVNSDYWKPDLVKVNRLRYRPISEEATRVAALRSGEVDIIANVSGELAEELGQDANIVIYRRPSLDHLYLLTQNNRPPFDNPDARWAVNYAIDRESLVKNIVKAGQLVGGHIPEGTVGYDASLPPVPYDPDEARRLLDKAGVAPGAKIEIKAHPFWFAKGKEVMEYVAGAMQDIGFEVDLQFLEPGAYTEARKSGSYNLALQQGGKANNPCNQYKTFYITDTYGSGYGPQHPDFQQAIDQACITVDTAQADELYKQIQKRVYDEAVEIQLYRQENIWAVRKRVSGFEPYSPDTTRPWNGMSVSA